MKTDPSSTSVRRTVSLVVWAALVMPLSAQEAVSVDALIGLARVKRDAGDPRAAAAYFEQARQHRTLSLDHTIEYFWCLAEVDGARARDVARTLLEARPAARDVRERAIALAAVAGHEDEVLWFASQGEQAQPQTALWPRLVGDSYLRRGHSARAAVAYGRAVTQADAGEGDWAGYAVALEGAGRPEAALDAWRHVEARALADREDWMTSRLRAMALAAPSEEAGAAIEQWLVMRPDAADLRGLLVEMWSRAGRYDRALAAVAPLAAGDASRATWLRREGELALTAGDPDRAARAFDTLRRLRLASRDTLWTLADLFIQTEAYSRAASVIEEAAQGLGACDERAFILYDRFPDPEGTDRLTAIVERLPDTCEQLGPWLDRTAQRALALGRHVDARRMVERRLAAGDNRVETRAIFGQLLLWTGEPVRAVEVLEPLGTLGLPAVADALVDAYRSMGQPIRAWKFAQQRVEDPSLSPSRRLDLAVLAIEADRPDWALKVAEAAESDEPGEAGVVIGRALLALGRPSEARAVLSSGDVVVRRPEAMLALGDAVAELEGPERALEVVRGVPDDTAAWTEVLARCALWEAVAGDRVAAGHLRHRVAALDARRAQLLEAEIALGDEQPASALAILSRLEADDDSRAVDLEGTALAGVGNWPAALHAVAVLRAKRPDAVPFALREADWRWRFEQTPERLEALLSLARMHPQRRDAATLASRALIEDGRFEEALDLLGGTPERWVRQPVEGRLTAARALRELGRLVEARQVVASLPLDNGRVALIRAELTATVDGIASANRLFEALALSPRSGPAVYLAWSAAQESRQAARDVLALGVERFSRHVGLTTALARADAALGAWSRALDAADRAISLDPAPADAWIVKVDATLRTRPDALEATLDQYWHTFHQDPALLVGMADRLAGHARSAHDPLAARARAWLDELPDGVRDSLPARLARARVLATSDLWVEALHVADRAVTDFPGSLTAHRLRADLLAFSGRHREALTAYATYLERAPLDVEAARLMARTSGWAGEFGEARQRYRALAATYPEMRAIAEEARAKAAFFDARWHDAVEAYERWLDLEPDNREAAFELAQSRLALGEVAAGERMLEQLDAQPPVHRFAAAAVTRVRRARRPTLEIYTSNRTSDGYNGLTLLDTSEQGASFTTRLGENLRAELGASGGAFVARAADSQRQGYRASVSGSYRFSPTWAFDGRAAGWRVDGSSEPTFEGRGLVSWHAHDRWRVFGGAERESIFQNLATVDTRLQGSGVVAGVEFDSLTTRVMLTSSRQSLSDGNGRANTTVAASRVLARGVHEFKLVGWAWHTAFDAPRVEYFSPGSFLRVDAGLEWSWSLSRPRFRGDSDRRLMAGYLVGTDSNGDIYHHPTAQLLFDLPAGLALELGGGWIRSDVYRETDIHLRLSLGGSRRVPW